MLQSPCSPLSPTKTELALLACTSHRLYGGVAVIFLLCPCAPTLNSIEQSNIMSSPSSALPQMSVPPNSNARPTILGIIWAYVAVDILVLIARFYVRLQKRSIGADDWCMLVALVNENHPFRLRFTDSFLAGLLYRHSCRG